jgi:hypothetical protein
VEIGTYSRISQSLSLAKVVEVGVCIIVFDSNSLFAARDELWAETRWDGSLSFLMLIALAKFRKRSIACGAECSRELCRARPEVCSCVLI